MVEQDEVKIIEDRARRICAQFGADPDEILDPYGPVKRWDEPAYHIMEAIEAVSAARITALEAELARLRLDIRAKECLQDSAYRAGMKAGWNHCASEDNEGYRRSLEGSEHIAELNRIRQERATLNEGTDA